MPHQFGESLAVATARGLPEIRSVERGRRLTGEVPVRQMRTKGLPVSVFRGAHWALAH